MLRPISFSIPSSTELKVVFNKEPSDLLVKDNFIVESISGNVNNLEIKKIIVEDSYVIVTTSPQVAGNFYVLRLVDAEGSDFLSAKGLPLINDDVSRDLFFVGLRNYNPVRDRMFLNVPKIYDLENSNVNNIITAQAEEVFQAQKHLGEVLSDNYISVSVADEQRTRSSGATDRLSNENAYEIRRVSSKRTNDHLVFKTLEYNDTSEVLNHNSIPNYPVSLQEIYVEEEISISSESNDFKGFLISLSNKNVVKLVGLKLIKAADVEDCDGNIGTDYKISLYKYSILDGSYDPIYAFENNDLESNQVLLSALGNIDEPAVGDTILVSYLHKDVGINVNEASLEVFNLKEVETESVPTNATRFFLEYAPIVNSQNEIPEKDGIVFSSGENLSDSPPEFRLELVFNSSKLPSEIGEYSVNYATGEVIVVGAEEIGAGTGTNNNIASYLYRNTFSRNLDYYIKDNNLVAASNRDIVGDMATIEFNYEKIFVEGVDYNAPCHTEIFNEHVENSFASSFVINPKNTPVTSVFRIYNQTTGEIYPLLYHTRDEIYFTGKRSPEIKTESNEISKFDFIELEKLEPTGEFICPAFSTKITANASNSNIQFSPGIPSELIDFNSENYFIRSSGLSGDDEAEDLQIRFFGEPNSGGLITSVSLHSTATAPSLKEEVIIGTKALSFNLNKDYLINNSKDSIGSYMNSSAEFTDTDIFVREKYFKDIYVNPGFERVSDDELSSSILSESGDDFYENLSRLRRVGDYSVDYRNGKVYLAVAYGQEYNLGYVNYIHGTITPFNKNIISVIEASKKSSSADALEDANLLYKSPTNTGTTIKLLDLDSTIMFPNEEVTALDLSGVMQDTCIVLEDYSVVVPSKISEVSGIYPLHVLEGFSLDSSNKDSRIEDLGSEKVKLLESEGGGNIFDASYMSFEDNVIDLKKYYSTRVSEDSGQYVINLKDKNFDEIYKIVHSSTGSEIFDEKLNVIKLDGLEIVSSEEGAGEATVDIKTGPILDSLDTDSDYLLDVNGSRFEVVSVDSVLSKITVASPAQNNVEATAPGLGLAQIIVKAKVELDSEGVKIEFPVDSFVNDRDLVEIIYTTAFTPKIGQELGVDCRIGRLYLSYLYVYDDVYISYEYGDNEIDWSISDSVSEGDTYYVSYRYGALRDALRKNFGVLTKIPYFYRFPLEADREVYRSALEGTMQSFTKGPTIPAFKGLIESFTDISPNVTESVFGNWILGRDYLTPSEITAEGTLEFKACKFGEGIMVNDDTVISAPALSNVNLSEGTMSAWICPEWAGIDNDATLEVSIEDIGLKSYRYKLNSNIFDHKNGFNILASEHAVGGTDYRGEGVTLHNYTAMWADEAKSEEDEVIGAFALTKEESSISRVVKTELDVSIKVSGFSAPIQITPPRRKPAEDLPFNRSNLGVLGLGKSLSDASRGLIVAGGEMELFRFCSPAFISIGDKEKLLLTLFSLKPLYNPESGRIYTFRVGYEHIEKNDVPEYDRLHITRSCTCSVDDTLEELSKFRDKDFQTLKIDLDFDIDFSYIRETDVVFDDTPSVFRILDTRGAIYEVYGFLDEEKEIITDGIPSTVSGFLVNRIPENQQYITAYGHDAINNVMPTGEITVLYQTITVLTKPDPQAVEFLGYRPVSHILDWMSDYVNFNIVRDPLNNKVEISINNPQKTNERNISLFYTDIIGVDMEDVVYEALNIDKWFNVANGIKSIDNSNSLSDKIAVGSLDRSAKSVIDVNKIEYDIYNRFTEKDIYIGSTARNPRSLPFTVSKYDFPKTSTGLPYNSDTAEGIFIGFDDLCLSPLAEDVGQWVFRSRVGDTTLVPFGVYASESTSEGYAFEYEYVPLDHVFSGVITTDGEFSSVVRAHRSEDGSGCPSGLVCAAEYRYCGDGLLEAPEGGWRRLGETSSDLINLLIGGYEGEASNWMKHGAFDTAVSGGVYRMGSSAPGVESCKHEVSDGNFVYTRLPCYSGDYSATVSFKVANMDYKVANSQFGRFDGSISGNLVGLTPVHIYDGNLNIKISLAISDFGHSLILILEGETNEIVDISYFDWDNGLFNYITIIKDADSESVIIQSDYNILSKLSFDDFYRPEDKVCSLLSEPFFAVHLFDGSLIDIIDFHDNNSGHVMDIGLVEYSGRYEDGINSLESEDILINTDSKIEFSFKNRSEFADGYLDGYLDGYGYLSDQEYDVDEIYFTSDKLRFLFDSGESDSGNRMSVFKDGKGFMNFRVYDNLSLQKDEVHMYNIATNIKDFKAGEMHHIAASWRLNTLHEKDEMHLFVDGLEAPNIYKFGGPVSVKVNDKFSDVSKEVLQDFLVDGIEYCDTFTDGTILAGTSKFISESAGFSEGMIGRSVLILDSKIAQTYIGGEYIINSVSGNEVTFVSGNNLDIVVFDVSASDISFAFPPIAGLKGPVSTDLRNSSFAVFREPCDGSGEVELGGILYSVDNGQVNIISGANVIYPKYRANVDTRVIEFVGQGDDCKYSNMIDFSDLNVHIKTFGLKFANFNEIINLSSSSYYLLDKKEYDVNSGKSVILAHAVEPVALEDVSIKRIILPRMIPEVSNILEEDVFLAGFEIPLVSDDGSFMVSSQSGQVHKTNLGRHLTIKYDSDNTVFCARSEDGYGDAYGDDLSLLNAIRVWGDIVDGSEYEEFFVTGNGEFRGEKLFRSVSKVEGDIYLADPNYEPFVIEIVETNSVTVSDNDGEYAEVFRYNNGSFVLTAAGSNGFYPFELHPGGYYLNYPAYLKVNLPRVGDRAYIGCDLNQENQFGGTIDEFRVITEMSSDTRPTEGDTAGTRSVTEDFFNPNPHCNDDQTLLLTHFDDPIRLQARRLRQKEFLNTESNFKFKLDLEDRETLLGHINDKDMFEATMIRMGFDKEIAEAAYTECHYAQGGPVFNEARFIRSDKMIVSSNSVNDNFGMSAKFFDTAPLVINNRLSYFRRDMGTVEFWTSPLLDTIGDELERYYVDIYSITKKRVTSFSPNIIDLPTSAKEIVSVQLLQNTKEFSDFFSEDEMDKIFFDEVYRSEVTGRLTGGTGVEKDFAIGSRLSADGRRIFLAESLPGANIDVVVSYIPIDSSGDRISIYKNEQSQIVFSITSNGVVNKVCKDVDWKRNTWHRIMCTYRANSGSDSMRLFLDGEDCGHITYGDNGVTYGSGFVYGQTAKQPDASKQVSYNLSLNDDFRLISIGSDIFGKKSSLSRLDNIRFSRRMRDSVKDPSGNYIDPNYSSNTDTVMPVAKDDSTTLILNFEKDNTEDTYATVIDPAGGVFNFDIEVLDSFSKINEDDIEDLIVQLVNRLKPAHANALVLFPRESC